MIPKPSHTLQKQISKTCPNIVGKRSPNHPKHVRKRSKNDPKGVPKKCQNDSGRTRNRTRYRPDPTPRPVRAPAHWANLVSENSLPKGFLCTRNRSEHRLQSNIFSEKAPQSNLSAEIVFFPSENNTKESQIRPGISNWFLYLFSIVMSCAQAQD